MKLASFPIKRRIPLFGSPRVAGVFTLSALALALPDSVLGAGFRPSGLDGAGVQNVIALDPSGSGAAVAGADVSGLHTTADLGQRWTTSNAGLTELNQLRVASVVFSAATPGTVYAATGEKGAGGGFFRSLDGGKTWSRRSTVPQFSGNNNRGVFGLPATHPRSTGNLIALDGQRGLLYVATFDDGVMRSADDGATWTTLGLQGKYLRSLVMDPKDPTVLYAAAYNDRVWRLESAGSTPVVTQLAASPPIVEELAFVGDDLYAASGQAGVFRSSDRGFSWTQVLAGTIDTTGPHWISIDGYVPLGGLPVLFVGSHQPRQNGGLYESILRSTDGGATWTPVTVDPTRIHFEIGGPGGPVWWHRSQVPYMLGGSQYIAAHIRVIPGALPTVLVAGGSGVWRSDDGGENWYPVVRGLGVTVNQAVAADPGANGRAYVGNTDWIFLYSTDSLASVAQSRPPKGPPLFTVGYDVALEAATTPAGVYLAVGNRDLNDAGEIFSNPDPAAGGPWVDEGLSDVAGFRRPLAVAVGRVAGAPVIVAAVEGGGVWRKSAGVWAQVSSQAMVGPQSVPQASLSWVTGSELVYLYDRQTGVWRSSDSGASWSLIWSKPSPAARTGFLAADPADPTRLYVSASDGLYRLDGADTGTVEAGNILPAALGLLPGPIALRDGWLYATVRASTNGAPPALYRSRDRGTTWENVADDVYRGAAGFPIDISVGSDGAIFVATRTTGVLVGSAPAPSVDTTPPAVPSGLSASPGDAAVKLTWAANGEADLAGYAVRHKPTTGTTWSESAGIGATATSHTVAGLTNDLSYDFQIRSVDAAGNTSAWSTTVSATLAGTLAVSLTLAPASGGTPLNGVDLAADVSGSASGPITYTFYCSRPDAGTDVQPGWVAQFRGVADDPKLAPDACSYPASGTFTAKVVAERGGRAAEARATVTVADTIAPKVSITTPAEGAVVPVGSTVTISASASDNVRVTRVAFFVNGAQRCSDTEEPFTCSWTVPSSPDVGYTLRARAFDARGNAAEHKVKVTAR